MMHYSAGFGTGIFGWHMTFQIVTQLIILILFLLVVWWLLKGNVLIPTKNQKTESASDILKKRLAKGEITAKEYHELKKEIGD